MKNKIYYSDLEILCYLFFIKKENIVLFDPQGRVEGTLDQVIQVSIIDELFLFCNNTPSSFILINLSDQSLSQFYQFKKVEGIIS